jgi:hypothetical protein
MNKEQQELLDEVYANYITKKRIEFDTWRERNSDALVNYREDTKELFLKSIKDNKHWFTGERNFSKNWGLKIEERELSPKERIELAGGKIQEKYPALIEMSLRVCDERDIPTRLITVTYNNKTIESYE